MRIDTLVNLVDGELINNGYIQDITYFTDELKKVKRESLFISNDINKIEKAIKKGVYAILFSEDIKITDKEIAWIKVDDLKYSILRIFKYKLLDKTLYICDDLTLQIVKSINKDKNLIVLEDKNIVDYLNNDDLIFITNSPLYKKLSTNHKFLNKKLPIKLLNSSLFITEFIFKNTKYKLKIPEIYLKNIQKVLAFFEEHSLKYNLKNIKIDRFIPQFIDKNYYKTKFGKTDKVVIYGIKKDNYFINELNFIFSKAKYGDVKFYDKTNLKKFFDDKFNFGILVDCDIQLNEKSKQVKNLFDF